MNDSPRAWQASYNTVCERMDFAEVLGIDLSTFRVTCRKCQCCFVMSADELLIHIRTHQNQALRLERLFTRRKKAA